MLKFSGGSGHDRSSQARSGRSLLWTLSVIGIAGIVYTLRGHTAVSVGLGPGRALVAEESALDVGRAEPSSSAVVNYRIRNTASRSISINGIQAACDCMTVDFATPKQINPDEVLTIPVHIDFPKEDGVLVRDLIVHTNNPEQRSLKLSIIAHVKPAKQVVSDEK